ncbi:hypothetical protein L486_00758 [Kwoniella mangroviensis CBS 10435]|uniref:Uncharacterized protein n=1 Tax=Kwoniella mangroviensis CBS 10435 TaxID=1331196 RepID=A0A1B9J0C2_9TREE|nr:hypothetical protein L486_00758 [Kwoniella mangroviensis CBS 10435]
MQMFTKSSMPLQSHLPKFKSKHSNEKSQPLPKPFQRTLHITNLPPTIKPSHFNYILSHPVHSQSSGRRGKYKDTGVSLVQIYHLPSPSPSIKARPLNRLISVFKRIVCVSGGEEDDDTVTCDTSRNSIAKSLVSVQSPNANSASNSTSGVNRPISPGQTSTRNSRSGTSGITASEDDGSRVEEREVIDQNTNPISPEQDQLLMNITQNVKDNEEEEKEFRTVAWIHFRDEDHLYRAKQVLRSITIDGRQIVVKTDRFNGGIIKRIWSEGSSNKKSE